MLHMSIKLKSSCQLLKGPSIWMNRWVLLGYILSPMWHLKSCDGRIPTPYILLLTNPCLLKGGQVVQPQQHPQEQRKRLQLLKVSVGKSAEGSNAEHSLSKGCVGSKGCPGFLWSTRNAVQGWALLVNTTCKTAPAEGSSSLGACSKPGHERGKEINSAEV